MNAFERLEKYQDEQFDLVLAKIRNGEIKVGKYSSIAEISKHPKIKGKEFFTDGRNHPDADNSK